MMGRGLGGCFCGACPSSAIRGDGDAQGVGNGATPAWASESGSCRWAGGWGEGTLGLGKAMGLALPAPCWRCCAGGARALSLSLLLALLLLALLLALRLDPSRSTLGLRLPPPPGIHPPSLRCPRGGARTVRGDPCASARALGSTSLAGRRLNPNTAPPQGSLSRSTTPAPHLRTVGSPRGSSGFAGSTCLLSWYRSASYS